MIAIPNMDKPKSCAKCKLVTQFVMGELFCDVLDKQVSPYVIPHDCPITDIVTCGECIHHDDGLCHRPKWSFAVEPTDFCSYGERRE